MTRRNIYPCLKPILANLFYPRNPIFTLVNSTSEITFKVLVILIGLAVEGRQAKRDR